MVVVSILLVITNCIAIPLLIRHCTIVKRIFKNLYRYSFINKICKIYKTLYFNLALAAFSAYMTVYGAKLIYIPHDKSIDKVSMLILSIVTSIVSIIGNIDELNAS